MWDTGFHVAFKFVLAALAVWRVSFLVTREDGPWDALARFRRGLGRGVLGRLFGFTPDVALALSLAKRVRELALGVPGLVAWQLPRVSTRVGRRVRAAAPDGSQ